MMMKIIKYLLLLIFPFLAIMSVKAGDFSNTSVGYSFAQPEYNISENWVTYSSSNLVKYNYELPNSSEIDINTFNIRMAINSNGFKSDYSYIVSFDWFNDYNDDIFLVYYNRMVHSLSCRVDNWNTTNQDENYCFKSSSITASADSVVNGLIHVEITFVPKVDFYGLTFTNVHDRQIYNDYPSEGWEVSNFLYSMVESGYGEIIENQNQNTQDIINNQNQNNENLINNQNQNTQDIIDNQNQNAQDIQNTINDNFQTCRDSYNLFRPRADFTNSILTMSNGVITLNGTLTSNTSIRVGYISAPVGSYTINPYKSGSISNSYFYFYIEGSSFSFSSQKSFTLNSSLTDESVWLVLTRGDYNNITMSVMLNSGNSSLPYEKYGEQVCKNKIDETNDAINNLNDSITDSTPPDTNSLSNASGWLPPGPVDSILNLPLTLLQSLNNAFSSNSCQPISIDLPHISNRPLVIPCMSTVWNGFGLGTFFTWLGRVIGGVLLYKYLIGLYKWVDDTLTMRENNNFDDGSLG